MSFRLLNVAFGCAFGLMLAGTAQAQPRIQPSGPQQQPGQPAAPAGGGGLVMGTNAENSARALQAAGYQDVEIITSENVKNVRAKMGTQPVVVWHYGCQNDNCPSVSFYTSFGRQQNIDINWINAWNAEKRFVKMYLDANGAVAFDMDIHFGGGTSPDYLKQSALLYAHMFKVLLEFTPKK